MTRFRQLRCLKRSSRGLGLAFVRQLTSIPTSEVSKVFATARGDSPVLDELAQKSPGRVFFVKLDGLDVLINNAGMCEYASDRVESMDNLADSFTINVLGVYWVMRTFIPLLQKDTLKKVANISTTLGSIIEARAAVYFPAPAYKISKAAMNALTVQYALDHEKEGLSFMAVFPGWMKPDLSGGDMADLTPEEGAKASLNVILKPEQE
ncbi:NAD(P)-binding protein [Hypoxylon crocopeplum]|nr:NAD(P)-binding protein [Hypoxylon crocopeplum]